MICPRCEEQKIDRKKFVKVYTGSPTEEVKCIHFECTNNSCYRTHVRFEITRWLPLTLLKRTESLFLTKLLMKIFNCQFVSHQTEKISFNQTDYN